jgi:Asp-tRNA(Asn)/Glu-tRNA(Gln) amidotransferase B subunit
MNEHRLQILQMLAEGKITADEAERLIAAVEKDQPAAAPVNGVATNGKAKAKYIRVVVVDNGKGTGPTVNIRVPMQLLRAGVKLASLLPVQVHAQVNDALRKEGVPIDLSQIKPENLEELIDHLDELTVDVDDKDVKVRVFCE